MSLDRLFNLMAEKSASDLFLSVGSPITIKINGVCVPINQDRLAPQAIVSLLAERVTDTQFRELEDSRELNIALPIQGVGSFRLSAFLQRGSASAVIRFIPHDIPKLDDLTLPEMLKELVMEKRGLILVVGAAGSGKSTTIASMLDHRNELMSGHILTFEDPIEFLFRNKKSIVNQREIGHDAISLQVAMKNAMRQAPDVMFIGEIRDRETMGSALAYAMSGHLVVATMHATNSSHALNRGASGGDRSVATGSLTRTVVSVKVCKRGRSHRSELPTPGIARQKRSRDERLASPRVVWSALGRRRPARVRQSPAAPQREN